MKKFSEMVVRFRKAILIIAILLLIPSAIGYFSTRVNYDILTYLPSEIETMKGQEILLDEFGTGGFSMCVVEGMENKDISSMRKKMEKVNHVKTVLWYDSIMDLSVPMELLPSEVTDFFVNKDNDATLMVALYDTSLSADETMQAVEDIRDIVDGKCHVSGMSAIVTDIKKMVGEEVPIYVGIAVILAIIVLMLTMDSAIVPIFFLTSIGMAILYNLGSNIFQSEISYVTQALAAVLQLGVTMDYSIFLWHSYEEERDKMPDDKEGAMALAIEKTIVSVVGSSVTTVAGFVALCFMSFTLGMDLGVVMAKGVIFGVIGCVTILPAMILVFDRLVQKTRHKAIVPDMGRVCKRIAKHPVILFVVFIVVLIPATFGYFNYDVYYDLAGTLPDNLASVQAKQKMDENFQMNSTHIILADSSMNQVQVSKMIDEMKNVDGVCNVLGLDAIIGPGMPREMIPKKIKEIVMNDKYQMMMINSEYAVASDEVNNQCDELDEIIKKYDENGMLIGEAPCTKDLITITNKDFKVVSVISIGLVFLIILFVLKSLLLPIILVVVIEFAIFINLGLAYYTGTELPFIASIVIGTIQLGATVDYAILMTNKYKSERCSGLSKRIAIENALSSSSQSVIVSALSFFAATIGVGLYSNVDMISSLCLLMSRGAIISMIVVILILPSMLSLFDKLIIKTSMGFKVEN